MSDISPWLALAGLGAFHGINPAMGWLFAVALGLHRRSEAVVLQSTIPIAVGHFLSITAVAFAIVFLGVVVDYRILQAIAGVLLISWAIYHAVYGHRHRVRVGMQTGAMGLVLWSFLMATSHGAGLMLVPVLMPLCLEGTPAKELVSTGTTSIVLAAVGVHLAAMLAVTTLIAITVYRWFGLAFLRRGWFNVDLIWIAALGATGFYLILSALW